jgi:hypothetical protein
MRPACRRFGLSLRPEVHDHDAHRYALSPSAAEHDAATGIPVVIVNHIEPWLMKGLLRRTRQGRATEQGKVLSISPHHYRL